MATDTFIGIGRATKAHAYDSATDWPLRLSNLAGVGTSFANMILKADSNGRFSAVSLSDAGLQPLDATLTALAGLATGADKFPYSTGTDTFAQADLTVFARSILDDANAGAVLTTLGVSAFAQTILDDAAATDVLTTLGVSAFVQTILNDTDAGTVRTTIGTVNPPASSTDTGIARFSGTDGKTIQNSGVTIDASNNVIVPGTLTVTGDLAMNSNDITTTFTGTTSIFAANTVAINLGTAADLTIGRSGAGTTTIRNATTALSGNLNVAGTLSFTLAGLADFVASSANSQVYVTSGTGSGIFGTSGHLIIQPRTSAARNVYIATGNGTPAVRVTVADATTAISNDLTVAGNASFGDASTDTVTLTGRLLVRSVTDSGMASTAGTLKEIVYNTSDTSWYLCTVTGSPATWVKIGLASQQVDGLFGTQIGSTLSTERTTNINGYTQVTGTGIAISIAGDCTEVIVEYEAKVSDEDGDIRTVLGTTNTTTTPATGLETRGGQFCDAGSMRDLVEVTDFLTTAANTSYLKRRVHFVATRLAAGTYYVNVHFENDALSTGITYIRNISVYTN